MVNFLPPPSDVPTFLCDGKTRERWVTGPSPHFFCYSVYGPSSAGLCCTVGYVQHDAVILLPGEGYASNPVGICCASALF